MLFLIKTVILRIIPVLHSTADNKGERGENKTGANITLYTVHSHGTDHSNNYSICDK